MAKSQITNRKSQIANRKSQATDHRSPITGHRSPITDHRSLVTDHRSPIPNLLIMHQLTTLQKLVTYIALVLLALFVLVPIWGLVYLAFDAGVTGLTFEFRVWPEEPSLDVVRQVWARPAQSLDFLGLLRNSLIVAGGAALLSVGLGASMAYAFARFRFPGRRTGLFALLVGALLPPVALMTPLYVMLTTLQLRTSLLGLTIVYTAFAMPFCVWNMRAAFQSVPMELEESAYLDGATFWIAFSRITLPLALPAVAVAGLIAFLIGYSEFALGWLFVEDSNKVTLAMAVWAMLGLLGRQPYSHLAAMALMMSAPVVIVFLLLQRYLLAGLSMGAVRGDR
jgi:arabinogalactan oligomer/maltooligosaccharide transport system permease protein